MAIEVIDKIKQKNNASFKIIDLDDIDYDGNGTSAKVILENSIKNIPIITNDLTNELKSNYDIAYEHSQSEHFNGDYNSLINKPNYALSSSIGGSAISADKINNKLIIQGNGIELDSFDGSSTKIINITPNNIGAATESYIDNKVDSINLSSYVLSSDLSAISFSGSYNDLSDTPTIPSIEGLATESFVTNAINEAKLSGSNSDIDLSIYAKLQDLSTVATSGSYNDLIDKPSIPTIPTLSTVAISGSYNDLLNKPSIDGLATEIYVDNTMKNSIGVPLSKYPRLNGEIDDSNRFARAFNDNTTIILDSNVTITSISIPDNCKLYCFGNYTITTSGTISVGFQSYLIGENLTIDASSCSDEGLKIISLSKWAKVKLYQIIGYKSEDSVKGSGSNATAVYCYHSDFVQVDILRSIKYCKVGFEITSGATGTGNTINRSYFKCTWMGEVETCFLSNESTSIMIDTEAYMEQCSIGYNVRAGFYGEHHVRFDHVDTWFVASLPEFRTRFGDIYIHNETMSILLSKIERYYNYTTWHCSDGIILPKDKDNPFAPQIRNHPDGRITVQSGLAKFRMVSAESIQYEGKYNNNDTSGGTVITLGGDYSEFHVERQDGTSIMSINKIGLLKIRNGIELGNATVGNANLDIKKGGVIFGRTPSTNAVNNMIYVDSDTSKLKFIDNNGTSHNVIFSGSYNDLSDKPIIITMDEVKAYVDAQIANITGNTGEEGGDPDIEIPEMKDFAYADEIVSIAKTYWSNSDNEGTTNGDWSTGLTYRSSATPLSGSCESSIGVDNSLWLACGSKYYKAIDCSTLANLYLRGYTYEQSPYASLNNFNLFRKDRFQYNKDIPWAIVPTAKSSTGATIVARAAAEIAEYFYNKGKNWIVYDKETMGDLESVVGTAADNYPGIKKGDLAFWAKSTANEIQKKRWRSISHVGLAYGNNSSGKSCFIESTSFMSSTGKHHTVDGTNYNTGMIIRSIENSDPEEIVLIIRLQV